MSYTEEQAIDHMLGTFKTAWDDGSSGWVSVLAAEPEIVWDNVDTQNADQRSAPWLRVFTRHFEGPGQRTFGGTNNRVFTRTGQLIVDVFVPIGEGLLIGRRLAKIARDAFEGKSANGAGSAIWFRNVSVVERGVDRERWFLVQVLAEFEYDEVK